MIMIDMLIFIAEFSWAADFVALCLVFALAIKHRTPSSTLLTLTATVLFCGLMNSYTPTLYLLDAPLLFSYKLFAWYIGFALLNGLAILTIWYLHRCFKLRYGMIARMALLQYFVLAQLQLLRYGERLLWQTDYLKPIYQAGIASINIGTALVALGFAVLALHHELNTNHHKGVKWTL